MEKEIIGERLGNRIAELEYSQQEFADMMGMKKDTLRSYISGKSAYSYELLIEFAEKLDCSYDYLLGYSNSPKREYHEVTEQTRLSTEAIEKLAKYAQHYDNEFEARRYIKSLDLLIREDGAFNSICDYFVASQPMNKYIKSIIKPIQDCINRSRAIKMMEIENDRAISLETQQMIEIISRLKDLKTKISPEFIEELKGLERTEDKQKRLAFLHELTSDEDILVAISKVWDLLEKYKFDIY